MPTTAVDAATAANGMDTEPAATPTIPITFMVSDEDGFKLIYAYSDA